MLYRLFLPERPIRECSNLVKVCWIVLIHPLPPETFAYLRPAAQGLLPLPGCLSQKCIAQCRLALRQAQGERKRQIPFVLSGLREALVEARFCLSSRLMRQPPGERVRGEGKSVPIQPNSNCLADSRDGLQWEPVGVRVFPRMCGPTALTWLHYTRVSLESDVRRDQERHAANRAESKDTSHFPPAPARRILQIKETDIATARDDSPMPANYRTPAAILEHQTAAWNAADVDAILQDFAPDAVLTSASGQTLSGIPAIRQSLTAFFSAFACRSASRCARSWRRATRPPASGSSPAATASPATPPASPPASSSPATNGKITHWREYYDSMSPNSIAQLGQKS